MVKTTQAQILDEIRHIVGLHPDGTRNGNGLLGTVNNLKKEINDIKKEMDSISKNIISITINLKNILKRIVKLLVI